ncbi:hypothetical protein [Flavobacterium dankookense]|uniref:Lipoprotein n=1 Tax=Flavobacterium dankookense TaxID=706186 RepID=A0A4R6QB76_9FLAO|nr:hypothetical protein [Flavobacterium dankookense]TDP59387.1 hypothetical protein BC748_1636 [Flavobacterium dankookense]
MKKKIRILKNLLLFNIVFMLFSCEVQEDFVEYKSEMKIKKVSVKDIMQKPEHKNVRKPISDFKEFALSKNKQNTQAKLIYNEQYGLYIDDENGVFIEKDGSQSYTFRIRRTGTEDKLENIVFKSNSNGDFETLIVTYDITYDEIKNLGKEEIPNRNVQYTTYNNQTESLPSLVCVQTWELMMVPIDQGDLTGNFGYEEAWVLSAEDCFWVGGGGGGSSSGGTGSGNTGGYIGGGGGGGSNNTGGTNTNTPIITTPITTDGDLIDLSLPELNKITTQNENGTNILRNTIDQMKSNLNNGSEEGIEFSLNSDDTYTPFPMPSGFDGIQFPPVSTNNPLIRMHKHHTGLDPIFSAEDIIGMVRFYLEKQNLNPSSPQNTNISSILVSVSGVHALRVSSVADLQDLYNEYQINQGSFKEFKKAYESQVIKKSIDECGGTCSDAEANQLLLNNLIVFINGFAWGIDFYFAPHPSSPNGDYTWKKK